MKFELEGFDRKVALSDFWIMESKQFLKLGILLCRINRPGERNHDFELGSKI